MRNDASGALLPRERVSGTTTKPSTENERTITVILETTASDSDP
jgi:hypothetical protein